MFLVFTSTRTTSMPEGLEPFDQSTNTMLLEKNWSEGSGTFQRAHTSSWKPRLAQSASAVEPDYWARWATKTRPSHLPTMTWQPLNGPLAAQVSAPSDRP